jgi:hypothetical protein
MPRHMVPSIARRCRRKRDQTVGLLRRISPALTRRLGDTVIVSPACGVGFEVPSWCTTNEPFQIVVSQTTALRVLDPWVNQNVNDIGK